jgi:hypothetical protein
MYKACYVINTIPKFIKKEIEVNVQNINSIFLELRDIHVLKNPGTTAMIE